MTCSRHFLLFSILSSFGVASFVGGCGDDGESGGNGGEGGDRSGSRAVGEAFCQSDKDCRELEMLCDLSRLTCVGCLATSDCGDTQICQASTCVDITPCDNSLDCASDEVCNDALGYCVECVGNNDCAADQTCVASVCEQTCTSDKDCRELEMLCDTDSGLCVGCTDDGDCASAEVCSAAGECMSQVCEPGVGFCITETELALCSDHGGGFETLECGEECVDDGETVQCTGGTTPTGGGGDGTGGNTGGGDGTGGSDGTGGNTNGNCANNTGDVCANVAEMTTPPTIDGNLDDWCDVPGMLMTPDSAALLDPASPAVSTAGHQAVIRTAYDADYFYLAVVVDDPTILHAGSASYPYDGDNVQLFISTEEPFEAAVGYGDNGHSDQIYFVPPVGATAPYSLDYHGAVAAYDGSDPSDDWEVIITDDGYVVEARWPWPADAPSSGDTMGFNLMVGVEDGATGRDYEYALALESVTTSACPSYDTPYCDARLWCTPTLD